MVSMFWVHYKRKADGQEFHERLTTGGMMKPLAEDADCEGEETP